MTIAHLGCPYPQFPKALNHPKISWSVYWQSVPCGHSPYLLTGLLNPSPPHSVSLFPLPMCTEGLTVHGGRETHTGASLKKKITVWASQGGRGRGISVSSGPVKCLTLFLFLKNLKNWSCWMRIYLMYSAHKIWIWLSLSNSRHGYAGEKYAHASDENFKIQSKMPPSGCPQRRREWVNKNCKSREE